MKRALPPKPANSNWTDAQWEAIHLGRENILVAAGAGSGKTRVLVERIIQKLLDEENPMDIDRLLVVTFTNAAAAEMRQRIGKALEDAIRENPANLRLRRQMLLLNRAPITTLHSFCREILRTYHYLKDLDPSSRILDDTEGDLLRQDLVEEVLEEFFDREEENKEPFFRLLEAFSTDRGDQGLRSLILQLYNFSRSHPRPEQWLAEKAAAFSLPEGGLARSPWFREMQGYWEKELEAARELLQRARQLALNPGGPAPYLPNLESEIGQLEAAEGLAHRSWPQLAEAVLKVKFASLKPCRGDEFQKPLAAAARELRDGAKKTLKTLKEDHFMRSLTEQEEDIWCLIPLMQVLVELVGAFAGKYRQAKEDRNVLDFSDLEHHALSILTAGDPGGAEGQSGGPRPEAAPGGSHDLGAGPDGGGPAQGFEAGPGHSPKAQAAANYTGSPEAGSGSSPDLEAASGGPPNPASGRLRPSQAARYYRQRFREVLVDEYQDTNEVQEAILRLLSRPPEEGGNLFMVGDVKQSIYRFRLAEPGLFLQKYDQYKGEKSPGLCIDLSKNFRSRREVLSAVNYLFHQIMDRSVGEVDYVQETALVYGASYPPPPPGPLPERGEGEEEAGYPVEVLLITKTGGGEEGEGEGDGEEEEEEGEILDDETLAAGEEPEKAALEGRLIARKIRELMQSGRQEAGCEGSGRQEPGRRGSLPQGPGHGQPGRRQEPGEARQPALIFDRSVKEWRPLAYRDIVILLRSTENWAPSLLEELHRAGIPAYAELGSGYFAAVEVEVMLSLLKVIDNPYQDIPLAAVLRSPLVGLKGEELARIRTAAPHKAFYEALKTFSRHEGPLSSPPFPLSPPSLLLPPSPPSLPSPSSSSSPPSHPPPPGASPHAGRADTAEPEGCGTGAGPQEKARSFLKSLQEWQRLSREGALAELIWQIYGETGYYELVGGMPGGAQRQANLRALYDRARQYENTSYRGLLRFLRFVEKLKERGGDLGVARALGEQEDVVRVMTIHKSKGLEFPVVFLAGLGKQFNQKDLQRDFLLHRELGFGPRVLDADLKVSYPTFPYLAVREKLRLELLAEEMRVLYVALTRAEERLFLVASVKDIKKEAQKWARALPQGFLSKGASPGDTLPKARSEDAFPEGVLTESLPQGTARRLPARSRGSARGPLDWLGPALLRHEDAALLRERAGNDEIKPLPPGSGYGSRWSFHLYSAAAVAAWGEEEGEGKGHPGVEAGDREELEGIREAVASLKPLPLGKGGEAAAEVDRRLRWQYPYREASLHLAKMTVSEIKKRRRQQQEEDLGLWGSPASAGAYPEQIPEKPLFMTEEKLSPLDRGTAYHAVMQYLELGRPLGEAEIRGQMEEMLADGKIAAEEYQAVKARDLAAFFAGPLGQRLLGAREVRRELAFSLALPARELYSDWPQEAGEAEETEEAGEVKEGEKVLVQGVLDCLFRDEGGLVLVDYKTDRTAGLTREELKERYREQLEIYTRAVADIWREEVAEAYLYFFDGGFSIPLGGCGLEA